MLNKFLYQINYSLSISSILFFWTIENQRRRCHTTCIDDLYTIYFKTIASTHHTYDLVRVTFEVLNGTVAHEKKYYNSIDAFECYAFTKHHRPVHHQNNRNNKRSWRGVAIWQGNETASGVLAATTTTTRFDLFLVRVME